MNQYCYQIINDVEVDVDQLKKLVANIYKKKKFESAFGKDLPFIVLYSKAERKACVKMTSRAKKNIEKIEDIHSKLKAADLKIGEIRLSKPVLVELEQCTWWDNECLLNKGQKWATLEHNGPYFVHLMEPYTPHGAPIIYAGKRYKLSPTEERVANFYARRIISEEAGNVAQIWTEDKVFNKNFWDDFKTYLTPEHRKIFVEFKKLNFGPIIKKIKQLKEEESQVSAKEKALKKVRLAEKKEDYGFAVINEIKEPLGNFTIEPAAIFYGRGENPKRGKIKRDIEPEEVTINIGVDASVPEPPAGHRWKEIINDQNVGWVAGWNDPISGDNKYVYFSAEGQLKGKSDLNKYEKARKLNKYLEIVRERYSKDIKSMNPRQKQLGTVLDLIDRYGIRVGNEKDDTETDTVGASTLRVEHVKLAPPDTVIFDFLGKDSIRYYKELNVESEVYKNFESFMRNKKPGDQLFDLISAADINNYLKTFDKIFSAKVFRTRLASTIMDSALKKIKIKKSDTADDKKKKFIEANVEVAEILNHQRTVSKKAKEMVKKYKDDLKGLKKELKAVKAAGKSTKAMETRIKNKQNQIENKENTLNVAINTSLANYIDPRLVVSWTKGNGLSIPKVYAAALQRKFKWAIDMTDSDWDYVKTPLLPQMKKLEPADPKAAAPARTPTAKKAVPRIRDAPVGLEQPAKGVQIIKYSDKSILVMGNTMAYRDLLGNLGGSFNKFFTVKGEKVPGWIFKIGDLLKVEDALLIEMEAVEADELVEKPIKRPAPLKAKPIKKPKVVKAKPLKSVKAKPVERSESVPAIDIRRELSDSDIDDLLKDLEPIYGSHVAKFLKCFGLQDEFLILAHLEDILKNPRVLSSRQLAKFMACIASIHEPSLYDELYSILIEEERNELLNRLYPTLLPRSLALFMLLKFIINKIDGKYREEFMDQISYAIPDTEESKRCLCKNYDDTIGTKSIRDLYFTEDGECVDL